MNEVYLVVIDPDWIDCRVEIVGVADTPKGALELAVACGPLDPRDHIAISRHIMGRSDRRYPAVQVSLDAECRITRIAANRGVRGNDYGSETLRNDLVGALGHPVKTQGEWEE